MKQFCRLAMLAALLCVSASAQADVTTGNVIGGFAEITNSVRGALPGQQPAPKQLKSPAHFGEKVLTEAKSRANISLIDGSHVLVGENAELTIDAFVFDPKTGKEHAVYNIAAGALRFVSGAIKSDSIKIQTPTAAIAVRGTNFKMKVLGDGTTVVSVNRGSVEVTSRASFQTATLTAGQSIRADRQGLGAGAAGNEIDVEDGYVDDAGLDGDPDLAEVGLGDLGFSDEDANEIEDALSEAESEDGADGDADGADGSEGGDADGGDSGDGGDGGDGGGGDGGGGGDN